MEPLTVCGWRECAKGRRQKPARQLRYCWRDLPGDRRWDKNMGMKLMKDFDPVNLSKGDEWARIRNDCHSSSLALSHFRLPFVFGEAEVRYSQFRGALDKIEARDTQE